MSQLTITLLILLLTIIGFCSGKVATWVVSMTATLALILTGILDFETAFGSIVDDNLVMMAAVVVLANGLIKTGIINHVGRFAKKIGGSERSLVACFCLMAIIISQVTKAAALLLVLAPIIFEICDECNVSYSRVLLPTSIMIVIAVGWLPISNGAAAWARYNALLDSFGYPHLDIWDLAKSRVFGIVLTYIWLVAYGYKMAPKVPPLPPQKPERKQEKELPMAQKIISVTIFSLVVLGMITSSMTGWDSTVISVIGAVAMVYTGVLSDKEALKAIPLGLILMISGTLNIAAALKVTGAAEVVGSYMVALTGGSQNPFIIAAILFILPFICTQFMSNTTVDNIFSTLIVSAAPALPVNLTCVLTNVRVAGSCGLMTPMATSSVPMVMGFGGYKIWDIVKCSLVPVIIVAFCSIVLNTAIVFPYIG